MIWGMNRNTLEYVAAHKVGEEVSFFVKTGVGVYGQYGKVFGKVVDRVPYTRTTLSGRVVEGVAVLIKVASDSPNFSNWPYMTVFVPECWGMQGGIHPGINHEVASKYMAEQDALVAQCMAL